MQEFLINGESDTNVLGQSSHMHAQTHTHTHTHTYAHTNLLHVYSKWL